MPMWIKTLGCWMRGGHLWQPVNTTWPDRHFGGARHSTSRLCVRCRVWGPKPIPADQLPRGSSTRVGIQRAQREIRARLANAQQSGDVPEVAACIADLRALADLADAECAELGLGYGAGAALRDLADTEEGGD